MRYLLHLRDSDILGHYQPENVKPVKFISHVNLLFLVRRHSFGTLISVRANIIEVFEYLGMTIKTIELKILTQVIEAAYNPS